MAHLQMIFPARNLHLFGIVHGYVSHNQMELANRKSLIT